MLVDKVMRNTILIIVINGVFLLAYKKINPRKEIERFYKDTSPVRYYMLTFAHSVLFISFVFNARFLAKHCLKGGLKRLQQKLLR